MTKHDIKAVYLAPIYLSRAIWYSRSFFYKLLENLKNENGQSKFTKQDTKKISKQIESELETIKKSFESINKKIPLNNIIGLVNNQGSDTLTDYINKIYITADESVNVENTESNSVIKLDNFEITHKGMSNTEKIDIIRKMIESKASDSEIVKELKKIIDK